MMLRARTYITNGAVAWKLEEPKTEPREQKHIVSNQAADHYTLVPWRGGSPRWSWMAPPCPGSSRLCSTVSKIKESCSLHSSESQNHIIVPSVWNGRTARHNMNEASAHMHAYIPRHTRIHFSDYKVDAQRQIPRIQKQFRLLFYTLTWRGSAAINLSQGDQLKVKGNSCSG